MMHLYAPPGPDFPETRCGLNRAWGNQYSAVYGCDFHLVDCPDCLAKLQMPPRATAEDEKPPHRDHAVLAMVCVVVGTFAIIAYLWWLSG